MEPEQGSLMECIQHLIDKETKQLKEENQLLQAKILDFYCKLEENTDVYFYTPELAEEYKEHFNIETKRQGEIK